jgi:hypothetical protein
MNRDVKRIVRWFGGSGRRGCGRTDLVGRRSIGFGFFGFLALRVAETCEAHALACSEQVLNCVE